MTRSRCGDDCAILGAKGDIHTFSTIDVALPVGPDDFVLTARSSTPTGLAWEAASGGLPDNIYMDEFGNVIFGAVNIAAFPADRAGTEMIGVYVDAASTVTYPPAGVAVNGLHVEGGAVVDLDGITSGAITDLTVLGATSAVTLSGPNITINAVRVEDGDVTGATTGTGTLAITKTNVSSGGFILFDDPIGTGGS